MLWVLTQEFWNPLTVTQSRSLKMWKVPQTTDLAKSLWMWALANDIVLTAEYIPGTANVVADTKSRSMTGKTDWKFYCKLFQEINQKWGSLEVDLFASCLSTQLLHYFSWRPGPLAEATDTFTQQWEKFRGHVNPPWCLVGIHWWNFVQTEYPYICTDSQYLKYKEGLFD